MNDTHGIQDLTPDSSELCEIRIYLLGERMARSRKEIWAPNQRATVLTAAQTLWEN